MKSTIKPTQLKLLVLGAGILGLLLRIVFYATATDHKGLLLSGHPAGVLIWVLTLAMLLLLFLYSRTIQGPEDYRDVFPVSIPATAGCALASLAVFITAVSECSAVSNPLDILVLISAFSSAVAFAIIGYCRITQRQPHFLLHCAVCVYFALRMVCQYRLWSSDPQLQDYVFYLLAYVCLMLCAFQHAAFDTPLGTHGKLWGFSLGAVYLCCLSLKGTRDTWLLLATGIWAFSNLSSLIPRQRRQRPALDFDIGRS